MARKSRGRQKIEMVKMKNESSLQVTFSKRRFGLFKKASELVTLCGAEVCLIVFSPGHKVFTFGHPSVESVIEKFLGGGSYQFGQTTPERVAEAHQAIIGIDLNNELNNRENLLEGEKRVGEAMGQRLENYPHFDRWGRPSVDELNLEELAEYKAALEGLKKNVDGLVTKLTPPIIQNNGGAANTNPFAFDSGNFDRNFASYNNSVFNRTLFAGQESDSLSSLIHQNLGAPGPSGAGSSSMNPSMSLGLDLGFGPRYF